MMTLAVEAALATLLALTLTVTRADRVSLTLAAAFAASVIFIPMAPDRTAALCMCDVSVVLGMRLWCSGKRAYFVGMIGFVKILTRTSLLYLNGSSGFWYAAAINAAFAAQLLIAGGFCDGLGHMLRRKCPRWSSVLEYVAG